MKLWKEIDLSALGRVIQTSANSLGFAGLMKDIMSKEAGHISEFDISGSVAPEGEENPNNGNKYIDYFVSKGGRLIYKYMGPNSCDAYFLWEDGIVELDLTSNIRISVNALSQNEAFIKEITEFFVNRILPPERKGHIYAIMRSGSTLHMSSIGNAGIPLIKDNYTPKVMEDYQYVIHDLLSPNPSGRIVVMEGEPGTGKTHLIRAMLMEVPDAMFVLVSPEMVTSLGGPELLPLLISYKGGMTGPIILVLEDADRCLVTRGTDNINSIQSLLNLGDGILGSLLDLRIIATTNAKKLEMEAAILRPGRLSKRLEVGTLDFSSAEKAYKRLLPGKSLPNGVRTMTIAEVYALARQNGWEPGARDISSKPMKDEDGEDYDY
jgi:hypothetical protein